MARTSRKTTAISKANVQSPSRLYQVGIYARLSVEDIRKKISDSIGTQKYMLESYVDSMPDLHLYAIYEDVNYTGTNFDRPGFIRMMEDAKARKIDCIIVKDLSRFGRNYLETGNYLERVFPFMGIRFIAVNDSYDSLTAVKDESGFVVPLKNLMNEVFARDISKKIQSSYTTKQKNGEYCGTFAPYGYTKVGGKLIVDEEAATVVKQMFAWASDGMSDIAIAERLNKEGLLSPSRYRYEKGIVKAQKFAETKHWYKSAVKRITDNPVYTGIMAQGKLKSNFLNGGGNRTVDKENWIVVSDTHPAIIDQSVFDKVQEIKSRRIENYHCLRTRSEVQPTSENIFKGLIFCGDCQTNMMRHKVVHVGNKVDYCFLCNIYEQVDKTACTKKSMMESELIKVIYQTVKTQIELAVSVEKIIARLNSQTSVKEKHSETDNKIAEITNKISRLQRLKSSLYADYVDELLSETDYLEMRTGYEADIADFQAELNVLTQEKMYADNTLSIHNKWIIAFRKFENQRELSRDLLMALIERIEIFNSDRVIVTFKYRNEFEAAYRYAKSAEVYREEREKEVVAI